MQCVGGENHAPGSPSLALTSCLGERTIAELADQVGVSRSALVERFTRYLSGLPVTYLPRWRLELAARSEAAFNRAFKREFGQPPGPYRSEHKAQPAQRPQSAG